MSDRADVVNASLPIDRAHQDPGVVRRLRYGDAAVDLLATSELLIDQFLAQGAPYGERAAGTEPDFELAIRTDGERFERLVASQDGGRPVVLSYCRTEAGTVRAVDLRSTAVDAWVTTKTPSALERSTVVASSGTARERYTFVVPPSYWDAPTLDDDGWIFLNHLCHKYAQQRGSVVIHASAVSVGGNGVLFAGPKRAGKTTMLFDAVHHLGARPVSLDKLHVRADVDGCWVSGIPSELRALPGTLKKYGDRWADLIPEAYRSCSPDELWLGESRGKVKIPIATFTERMGVEFERSVPLRLVVLPDLAAGNETRLHWLDGAGERREALGDQVYTPTNPEEDWWSGVGADADPGPWSGTLTALVTQVPFVAFATSHDTETSLRSLLEPLGRGEHLADDPDDRP